MRPAWRLATNSLSGRKARSGLLAGAVALSAALVVTVACAMATVRAALNRHVEATVGRADLRLRPSGSGRTLPAGWLQRVRAWSEVAHASGRLEAQIAVAFKPGQDGQNLRATALGSGTEPGSLTTPPETVAGRLPQAADEIAIDALLADLLSEKAPTSGRRDGWRIAPAAPRPPGWYTDRDPDSRPARVRIGDRVKVLRQRLSGLAPAVSIPFLDEPVEFTVVGVTAQPPLGGRAQAFFTLAGLAALVDAQDRLSQIDILVRPGVDPEAAAAVHRQETDDGSGLPLLLQTTSKVTSGVNRNMQSSQLGFILATFMAFLSASFIVLTGLTTSVSERQRELAILRCIGAERGQLARAQVYAGALLGAAGAVVGVPLGLLIVAIIGAVFREQLAVTPEAPASGLVLAAVGAVGAGAAGAAWPAWRAARLSPLTALAARAAAPRARGIGMVTLIGAVCVLLQLVLVGAPRDGQVVFWAYATAGLPLMFIGYFLLGVPAALIVTRIVADPLSRLLALPPRILVRTVEATPYRHGLTAGALMGGLALMVAIWTNGGAFLRDWIEKIQFPDAFVSGLALTPESQRQVDGMTDIVERTCAITLHPVETDVFGVRALQRYKTTFIAFEPEPFFAMMNPTWVQGSAADAAERLRAGGAIIVAREFLVAQGLGLGDKLVLRQEEREHAFEIVGVVTSPGLEIVSKFFNIGEDYTDQSMHAVFGSRADLRDKFGSDAIHLIQIDLKDGVDDEAAVSRIREALFGRILDAGSGRSIKEFIRTFAGGALAVITAVAVVAMLVACFGVANVVIAGIEARRFEFGVLRAVGAHRSLLSRLVIAEVVVIAVAACVLGTLMGVQGSWAGQRIDRLLFGIDMRLRPPPLPVAAGWLTVLLLTLASAAPAVARLARCSPRDLLASTKG